MQIKQDDDICFGCHYGQYNSTKVPHAGYDCGHPNYKQPERWPQLVIDINNQILSCEFLPRYQSLKMDL